MAMECSTDGGQEYLKRKWCYLRKLLSRPGPLCHPEFEPSPDLLKFLIGSCKVLVIGAGGLGCELLKNLALMGFHQIHVIDMDTIDLSNLNRQFLFRRKDVGQSKARVAADFINRRLPSCSVTPHFNKIQDFDEQFYRQFHIVASGLDSIVARRWINGMLLSLVNYSEDTGEVEPSSVIPLVDGGTEGFKGNARVVLPGLTACIDCTLDLFPPQVTYPLCTIANTPRLPEHCIEYVKVMQWPKENPFEAELDGDDPVHLGWVFEKSQERASQFSIAGVTYRLVQGVIKNIIPAVSSTNAVIAAACATEVFKVATSCCLPLNNYMVLNDVDGVYTYRYEAERREDCLACSQTPSPLVVRDSGVTLAQLIDQLRDSPDLQMKNPGITAMVAGSSRTLYVPTVPSLEQRTRVNLAKNLADLGLVDGTSLLVADLTSPNTLQLTLKYSSPPSDMVLD